MIQSESISELAAALAKAHTEIEPALKQSEGQVGRSPYKYADLAAVVASYRESFAKHGLSVIQGCLPSETGTVRVQTTLLHSSGQFMSDEGLILPAPKNDPQGFGSALTYARRYGLAALCGVVTDDDDGDSAVQSMQPRQQSAAQPVQKAHTSSGLTLPFSKSKGLPLTEAAEGDLRWVGDQLDVNDEKYGQKNAELQEAINAELLRRHNAA